MKPLITATLVGFVNFETLKENEEVAEGMKSATRKLPIVKVCYENVHVGLVGGVILLPLT